jgi:hypothetical protein
MHRLEPRGKRARFDWPEPLAGQELGGRPWLLLMRGPTIALITKHTASSPERHVGVAVVMSDAAVLPRNELR